MRVTFFGSRRTPESVTQPTSYRGLVDALTQPLNGSMNLYWVDASIIDSLREE
jgi:hypothetical protein